MSGALDRLQYGVLAAFGAHCRGLWDEPQAMTPVLEEVRLRHDSPAGRPVSADRIARAVAAFRATGRIAGFVELKHVCLGAAAIDAAGDCLLAEARLRDSLLLLAETVPTGRRQIKCFQCLLRSFWSFPVHGAEAGAAARAGLDVLRAWLARRYAELDAATKRKPRWFATLAGHANLLGSAPCERYGPALLRGDAHDLQGAVDGLAIPGDSWVTDEAVLAQLRAAAALADADWTALLPQLLEIATGRAGIAVSEALARRGVALLVSRYARCDSVDAHEGLLDAALAAIGNPWLRRAAWDAFVLEADGRAGEHAREMVGSWLKQRLIGDFFRLCGGDRDARRPAYWQRFDPFIHSLWIGLGAGALERSGAEHEAFRRRCKGCLLGFDDVAGNALILRIGDTLIVEFGGKGRGAHLFPWSRLDPALARRLTADRDKRYVNLDDLMQTAAGMRLDHRDSSTRDVSWEQRFDEQIRPLVWQAGGGLPRRTA